MDFFSNIGKDIKGFFSGDQQGPEVESAGPFLSHGGIYQATIRRPDSLHITAWGPNGAHFEGNWKQSAELGRLFQAIKTGQAELHLQNGIASIRCANPPTNLNIPSNAKEEDIDDIISKVMLDLENSLYARRRETGKDFESDMKIAGMWLVAAQELLPFSNVFTDGKNAVLHCKRIAEFLTKVQIELDGVSLPRTGGPDEEARKQRKSFVEQANQLIEQAVATEKIAADRAHSEPPQLKQKVVPVNSVPPVSLGAPVASPNPYGGTPTDVLRQEAALLEYKLNHLRNQGHTNDAAECERNLRCCQQELASRSK